MVGLSTKAASSNPVASLSLADQYRLRATNFLVMEVHPSSWISAIKFPYPGQTLSSAEVYDVHSSSLMFVIS